jgi:hypothetical protein
MTKDEAEARARELAAADESHSYFARERDGEWQVAKMPALGKRVKPTVTSTEERPRPEADDPRTSLDRNIPGYQG